MAAEVAAISLSTMSPSSSWLKSMLLGLRSYTRRKAKRFSCNTEELIIIITRQAGSHFSEWNSLVIWALYSPVNPNIKLIFHCLYNSDNHRSQVSELVKTMTRQSFVKLSHYSRLHCPPYLAQLQDLLNDQFDSRRARVCQRLFVLHVFQKL